MASDIRTSSLTRIAALTTGPAASGCGLGGTSGGSGHHPWRWRRNWPAALQRPVGHRHWHPAPGRRRESRSKAAGALHRTGSQTPCAGQNPGRTARWHPGAARGRPPPGPADGSGWRGAKLRSATPTRHVPDRGQAAPILRPVVPGRQAQARTCRNFRASPGAAPARAATGDPPATPLPAPAPSSRYRASPPGCARHPPAGASAHRHAAPPAGCRPDCRCPRSKHSAAPASAGSRCRTN